MLAGVATVALLDNATLNSQVTAADARAANAVSAAQAAAHQDYEARNAALNREAALNGQRQAIAAETGELQANTIAPLACTWSATISSRAPGIPPVTARPAVVFAITR